MRTIYIDSDFKCHTINDGTMSKIETDFFDNKCDTYIEGHCYILTESGGNKVYAWRPYSELISAQYQYESMQQELIEYSEALELLGVDLNDN